VPGQELATWPGSSPVARNSRDRRELEHYAANTDGAAALIARRLVRSQELRKLQHQLGTDLADDAVRAMQSGNPLQRVVAEQAFSGWLRDSERIVGGYANRY
jgi:hypothetical protein